MRARRYQPANKDVGDASRAARVLSVANLLSLSRIPLGAVFAWALTAPPGGRRTWVPFGVLALAGLTDVLDGWFARRAMARATGRKEGTPAGTGSWLDPICDKIFVAAVLGAIWFHDRPPLAWLALILARELAQLPLSLVYAAVPALRKWLRYDFRASVPGKAATVTQFAAVSALVLRHSSARLLAWASFVVGMIALADYLGRAVRIGQRRLHPPARGAPAPSAAVAVSRSGTSGEPAPDDARHAAS
jgi:phosphatidylglycerophosphate synthase